MPLDVRPTAPHSTKLCRFPSCRSFREAFPPCTDARRNLCGQPVECGALLDLLCSARLVEHIGLKYLVLFALPRSTLVPGTSRRVQLHSGSRNAWIRLDRMR